MKNGIDMKRIYAAIVFFMCSASLTTMSGCSGDEGPAGPEPPVIEDYVITPINGGGIATYSIPDSEEVMYVMAEYERNGKKCVERSSVYSNTIRMEGFATTDPVTVAFYTVSRNGVRSEPVVKTFEPLTAPLYLVRQTLSMVTDFGGVSVFWENRFNTEVGVAFLVKDENGEFRDNEYRFSRLEEVKETFRGFEAEEATFGACLIDNWGNTSDTLELTTTPYYETMSKKPFSRVRLPGDVVSDTWAFSNVCNGTWHTSINTNSDAWLSGSKFGNGHMFTIDLGERMKMSRVVLYPRLRTASEPFGSINVRNFEVWGTSALKTEMLSGHDYYWQDIPEFDEPEEGGVPVAKEHWKNDWQCLGEFEIVKPDVPEGANQQEIFLAACGAGFSFDFPIDAEPIHYIRFVVRRTWSGAGSHPDIYPPRALNDYFMLSELSMYGDNTVPQK